MPLGELGLCWETLSGPSPGAEDTRESVPECDRAFTEELGEAPHRIQVPFNGEINEIAKLQLLRHTLSEWVIPTNSVPPLV